jgi:hypothetical protein
MATLILLGFASVTLAARPNVGVVPSVEQAQSGIPVARIFATGPGLEILKNQRWSALADGYLVKTGDHLRTKAGTAAAIQLPWTTVIVGSGSSVTIAPSIVLTASLEAGRVEQRSKDDDIVKVRTGEALVRGRGHVVVKRSEGRTFVSAIEGAFDVATGSGTLRLEAGLGTTVLPGERPSSPQPLTTIAKGLDPGPDPVYFPRKDPVELRWESAADSHHVQVQAFDSDALVHDADVSGSRYSVRLPLGLFRWRVSPASDDGPEGRPSPDGFVCVVED